MRCTLVLGVMSEDRTGILNALSAVITKHGGEWTESKMVTMAGKFAGISVVELPCRFQEAFEADLNALIAQGIRVWVERTELPADLVCQEFHLEMVGQDRPGIIREITGLLAQRGINLEALESRIESASMSGEMLFIGSATLQVPENIDLAHLQDDFEALANEMMVDFKLSE